MVRQLPLLQHDCATCRWSTRSCEWVTCTQRQGWPPLLPHVMSIHWCLWPIDNSCHNMLQLLLSYSLTFKHIIFIISDWSFLFRYWDLNFWRSSAEWTHPAGRHQRGADRRIKRALASNSGSSKCRFHLICRLCRCICRHLGHELSKWLHAWGLAWMPCIS